MLPKRIIGVITVLSQNAVQSIGYKRYLPLGKPEVLAENLERWAVDEIFLQCIDRSILGLGPDFDTLKKVSSMAPSTPLTYSGGIRNCRDAVEIIAGGAERICVEKVLDADFAEVREISSIIGSQALIASIPIFVTNSSFRVFNYFTGLEKEKSISNYLAEISSLASEILITDVDNEGKIGSSFNEKIVEQKFFDDYGLILFGGINNSEKIEHLLLLENVKAVAIGNYLNYRESSVFEFRKSVNSKNLRKHESM